MDTKHIDQILEEAARAAEIIKAQLAGIRDEVHSGELEGPGLTVYSQRDPKWASVRMGSSIGTIGAVGCLITSIASMLTDAGKTFTPDTLNSWLIQNGGYISGNLFVYASVDKLGVTQFKTRIDCPKSPAPMSQLDSEIASNNFVIVKVNNGLPPDYHWVRYIGDGKMIDPWYGDIATITPRYKGANAAECIRAAVIYKRVSA